MAKRNRRSQRDALDIATSQLNSLVLRPLKLPEPVTPFDDVTRLSDVSDRRFSFYEDLFRSGTLTSGGEASLRVAKPSRRNAIAFPAAIAFRQPQNVVECVRRKQRRAVLFAHRKTRKGAGARRRRRTRASDIRC